MLGESAPAAAEEAHLDQALAEAGDDAGLRAHALARKAMVLAVSMVERLSEAERAADEAWRIALHGGNEMRIRALTAQAWTRMLRGRPVDDLRQSAPGRRPSRTACRTRPLSGRTGCGWRPAASLSRPWSCSRGSAAAMRSAVTCSAASRSRSSYASCTCVPEMSAVPASWPTNWSSGRHWMRCARSGPGCAPCSPP